MIGFGLENLSLIFGGLKFGGSSSSPSKSKAKGLRVPLGLGPSRPVLEGGPSSSAAVVRDAVRADLRVPRAGDGFGSGVNLEGGLTITEADADFGGVDFLEGVDFAGGFLGGEDFTVDLVGVVGRSLPFVMGCLLATCAREGTGRIGVDDTSFLCCSDCRLENLVGRVESPPLLLAGGGGSNSKGIAFVLPDFLRPELSRNEVGVWVVALFHGGELSIFRFLLGGFLTSGDSPSPSSPCRPSSSRPG